MILDFNKILSPISISIDYRVNEHLINIQHPCQNVMRYYMCYVLIRCCFNVFA